MAAEQPHPSYVLRGHNSTVHSVCFAGPNNNLLLAGDESGQTVAWNLDSRRPAASWSPSGKRHDAVLCVHELSYGRWLTQCKDGVLRVWHAERVCGGEKGADEGDGEGGLGEEASVDVELHSFCKCAVLDRTTVAVPVGEGVQCGLWDTRSNTVSSLFSPRAVGNEHAHKNSGGGRGPTGMCMSLAASGPHALVGGYEDGSVQTWDSRCAASLHSCRPHSEPVFGIGAVELPRKDGASVHRSICASGGADGALIVSEWRTPSEELGGQSHQGGLAWQETGRFESLGVGIKGVNSVHVRSDAKILATGCWDGKVRVFAVKKPRVLASLEHHSKGVQCVKFSKDARLLASCSDDTRIAVWELYPPA